MVLGWSPLCRKLLDIKRKTSSQIDEVEDGARALFLEEGLSAFVFESAKEFNFFQDARSVDFEILRTVKTMTRSLEVAQVSYKEWERAILVGFEVWRQLREFKQGVLHGNRTSRSLVFVDSIVPKV